MGILLGKGVGPLVVGCSVRGDVGTLVGETVGSKVGKDVGEFVVGLLGVVALISVHGSQLTRYRK